VSKCNQCGRRAAKLCKRDFEAELIDVSVAQSTDTIIPVHICGQRTLCTSLDNASTAKQSSSSANARHKAPFIRCHRLLSNQKRKNYKKYYPLKSTLSSYNRTNGRNHPTIEETVNKSNKQLLWLCKLI